MTSSNFVSNQRNSELISQLEEELQLAKFLLNHVADAAFCLGSNAQFLYVNTAACDLTEYSRQELLLKTLQDVVADFDLGVWLKQWRSLQQQGSLTWRSLIWTKTKQILPVEITATYVRNCGREFICASIQHQPQTTLEQPRQYKIAKLEDVQEQLSQEVSKLGQTEAELEQCLTLLRATLESTANGIVAISFEGEIVSFNQKFIEMWSIPDPKLISKECKRCQAFFEDQLKNPEVFCKSVWEVPSQSDIESYDVLELKDGRFFAHYAKPQRLGKKIIGRVWSVWDITESKRTEDALRMSETRFRMLAETTDAIIFLIQDMRLCYVNPAAEIVTGYRREELLTDFDLKQLIKSREHRQAHTLSSKASTEYQEMNILTKNGMNRWLACSVGVLNGGLDFAGKSVELITAIDITDYKCAEVEVRQTLEQAKQLSDLRARFVSMVSHELRTPLNVVSFSTSLLRRHTNHWNEEKKRPYLDQIQTAVEQISKVLDESLFIGKMEAGKLKFEPKLLDLKKFCYDTVVEMQRSSETSEHIISLVSQADSLTVCVDKNLLQPILTNLLSNAVKYSSAGSTVTLKLASSVGNVILQVQDQGIGIPMNEQQQLFDPYYRGSNVGSRPGTGLGLAIVKNLVDIHNGQITVASVVGEGTTFTVTLPIE